MNIRSVAQAHGRHLLALCALALAVGWLATHQWSPEAPHLEASLPYATAGDEPHYLIMIHSLLYDRDLHVADEYDDAAAGGPQAGRHFRHGRLDPQARLLERATGASVLWLDHYEMSQRLPEPDEHGFYFGTKVPLPFKPGTYDVLPAHPPAFPALLATIVAPFRPGPEQVEPLAGGAIVAFALLTLFAAYGTGIAAGLSKNESVGAIALFALCSPWLPYTRSFFSGSFTALVLLGALWAHLRCRPVPAALGVVAAFWIKPMYVVVGGIWLIECLARRRIREALFMAATMGIGGVALLAFNQVFAGTLYIVGNGSPPMNFSLSQIAHELISPNYGLLVCVPWVVMVIPGALARAPLGLDPVVRDKMLLPCAANLFLLLGYSVGGGASYACRYWIPFIPLLAILAVVALRRGSRPVTALLALLACAGFILAIPAVLQFSTSIEVWMKPAYVPLLRMLGCWPG